MGTKQFSNYSDLLTFTRASKGHALRPVSYGDELVNNGTFDSDTSGWTSSSAFTATLNQSAGELSVTSTGNYGRALQAITCEIGKIYSLTCDVTEVGTTALVVVAIASSGTVNNAVFSKNDITSTQTVTAIFVATQQTHYVSVGNQDVNTGVTSKFDNISVKEVLFDQPDGTLTLFEHPENVPRVEYDADGNRLGLLVEESRTNLERYSDFSFDWASLDSTEVQNAIAPDGTETAFTVTRDSTSYGGFFFYNSGTNISVTSGSTYSISIYLKQGEMDNVTSFSLKPDNSGLGGSVVSGSVIITPQADGSFSLSGDFSASSENVGNGWYRISFSFTATATGTAQYGLVSSGSSNFPLNSSVLVWGPQVEAGSFPTSYIKTTGATATRSADVASIPVADFGYNADGSTFIAEASELGGLNDNTQRHTLFSTETASALRLYVGKSGGGGGSGDEIFVGEGASGTYFELGDITQNTFYKVGVVVKTNDISASLNGGAIASDSSVALAKDETTMGIGSRTYAGTNVFNGHIKSIKYYPRRLSNAQLQDLTS